MKLSTGLRDALLGTGSFSGTLNNHVITIFSGAIPSSADDGIGAAVALCEITVSDDGFTPLGWDAAANGVIQKAAAEAWQGTVDTSGTASFFRMHTQADTNASSTTATRLQGTVTLSGGDLNLSSLALTAAAVQTIDSFSVAMPAGS